MDCTIITEIPKPMAVEIYLDTAINVHNPRQKDSARFSTNIAFTANEIKASINEPLTIVSYTHELQLAIFSTTAHPKLKNQL